MADAASSGIKAATPAAPSDFGGAPEQAPGHDADAAPSPSPAPAAPQQQQQQQQQTQQQTPTRERHSLSLEQRRALRRWAFSRPVRPSHKDCIDWFRTQYAHTISQSTVSHSLSPKYARLDGSPQLSGSRLRFGNWPDVEKLVLLWYGQALSSGARAPTNDDLAAKARDVFAQLPRYRGEEPPEFSPGWIHRFKKRYGLLLRKQRRHADHPDPAADVSYLADAVPRFMTVGADTSPAAIRDAVHRVVGVEPSLAVCARVRDDIVRGHGASAAAVAAAATSIASPSFIEHGLPMLGVGEDDETYDDADGDDPELVLQNALRAMQQEEADAEAEAAAVREARDRLDPGPPPPPPPPPLTAQQSYAQHALANTLTPSRQSSAVSAKYTPAVAAPVLGVANSDPLTLTPISSDSVAVAPGSERPLRCPFCVNQRMLRSIKEAVEHMSTHVIV